MQNPDLTIYYGTLNDGHSRELRSKLRKYNIIHAVLVWFFHISQLLYSYYKMWKFCVSIICVMVCNFGSWLKLILTQWSTCKVCLLEWYCSFLNKFIIIIWLDLNMYHQLRYIFRLFWFRTYYNKYRNFFIKNNLRGKLINYFFSAKFELWILRRFSETIFYY